MTRPTAQLVTLSALSARQATRPVPSLLGARGARRTPERTVRARADRAALPGRRPRLRGAARRRDRRLDHKPPEHVLPARCGGKRGGSCPAPGGVRTRCPCGGAGRLAAGPIGRLRPGRAGSCRYRRRRAGSSAVPPHGRRADAWGRDRLRNREGRRARLAGFARLAALRGVSGGGRRRPIPLHRTGAQGQAARSRLDTHGGAPWPGWPALTSRRCRFNSWAGGTPSGRTFLWPWWPRRAPRPASSGSTSAPGGSGSCRGCATPRRSRSRGSCAPAPSGRTRSPAPSGRSPNACDTSPRTSSPAPRSRGCSGSTAPDSTECSGPPPAGGGRFAMALAGSDLPPGSSSASPATAPTPPPAPAPPRAPILSCSKAPPRSDGLPAPRPSTGWASRRSNATIWQSSAWRRWATSSRCPQAGFASDSTGRPPGSTTWPPARPGLRSSPRRLPSGWRPGSISGSPMTTSPGCCSP